MSTPSLTLLESQNSCEQEQVLTQTSMEFLGHVGFKNYLSFDAFPPKSAVKPIFDSVVGAVNAVNKIDPIYPACRPAVKRGQDFLLLLKIFPPAAVKSAVKAQSHPQTAVNRGQPRSSRGQVPAHQNATCSDKCRSANQPEVFLW